MEMYSHGHLRIKSCNSFLSIFTKRLVAKKLVTGFCSKYSALNPLHCFELLFFYFYIFYSNTALQLSILKHCLKHRIVVLLSIKMFEMKFQWKCICFLTCKTKLGLFKLFADKLFTLNDSKGSVTNKTTPLFR